ncbi:DUF5718 family protein [Vibrio hippocampi]|uniref:DUF5718 family protein n=1 Tax=Vibrio hippocampi TaxID=654686 RepID=UPI001F44E1C6|nr:DUF5718 family protein [Vibrio hippocampi]
MINSSDDLVLGIAGNSPGYLAQTGEIKAFSANQRQQHGPKALFPIYVKGHDSFLGTAPFCQVQLRLPASREAVTQMEPELAVRFKVEYGQAGDVAELRPFALSLINDATHRNRVVTKLAQKKNWGPQSKGALEQQIAIDSLQIEGMEHYRICGFLGREGQWHQCSEDVSVSQYTVFSQALCDWLVQRIAQQRDESVLDDIGQLLVQAGCPRSITVAIGAPSYTEACRDHQLQHGDEMVVCLYDQRRYQFDEIQTQITEPELDSVDCQHKLVLRQRVISDQESVK